MAAQSAGLLDWLHASPISLAMRHDLWLYPIVEIIHITGFIVLVGAVIMFDLRVLGFAATLPIDALGRHLLRWSAAALILIVPSGLLMFSAHPQEFIENPIFVLKLGLIAAAGTNALLFHAGIYRSVAAWNVAVAAPLRARIHTFASILIWLAVVSCGRLLAYT